jgi:hypothetical protein
MDISSLSREYNTQLSIRDSLPIAKAEQASLEEDENVQRYNKLKKYIEGNSHLEGKKDNEILDELLSAIPDLELEDDFYFCFGKNFNGYSKKTGGYYIDNAYHSMRLHPGIKVTKYQSISRINDIVIIPSVEAYQFEQEHQVYFHLTDNPEEEYKEIRRNKILRLMNQEQKDILRLKKEL